MTRAGALVDTGPLVAVFDRTDANHERAKALMAGCESPLRTCEAVLAEASHLLSKTGPTGPSRLVSLGRTAAYEIVFRLDEHCLPIERTLAKYQDVPASLADACLIRSAEVHQESRILTFDSDFVVYRWARNKKFQVVV